jgi:hypothetical protein
MVMVEVCIGEDVRAGASVGTGVLVEANGLVGVCDGAVVAVHVEEGVADARVRISGRTTAPVISKEMQAIDIKTRTNERPK